MSNRGTLSLIQLVLDTILRVFQFSASTTCKIEVFNDGESHKTPPSYRFLRTFTRKSRPEANTITDDPCNHCCGH